MSLKIKLVTTFTAIIFLLTAGIGVVSIQTVSRDLITDAKKDLEQMASSSARYIKAKKDSELKYIEALARNPIFSNHNISLEEKIAFCENESAKTGFLAFAFADKEGNSTVMNLKRESTNVYDREYFQTALNGSPATSDLIISSATGKLVLIYAAPVYKNNEVVGVLYGRRDGQALTDMVKDITYGKSGYGYLVNNNGTIVGHPNMDFVFNQLNLVNAPKDNPEYQDLSNIMAKEVLLRQPGSKLYKFGSTNHMLGFAPVEDSPWIIVISAEEKDILSQVNVLKNVLITLCFGALIVGIIITYIFSGKLTKPIIRITEAAKQIATGKFDVHLLVNSRDEVGQLAQAFQLTIDQLINYQSYIDELANSLLKISKGDLTFELERDYVGQFKVLKDNMHSLLKNLNNTLLEVNQASVQVSSGADQVSCGAQALSQGTTEQASSIEELSASIAEVTEQIRQNAENAKLANESAELAGKEIFKSNAEMTHMVEAMNQINAKSAEISKIIKVIEDIA
ncbi:MAG: methyl-accepting chemotaxis sensory transducer with Cache sensor, partial [Neobacillus sp.]|nr:methyl-accepting chemotaxis sensory transducer with Cache sensor [Neobacillus sp.]